MTRDSASQWLSRNPGGTGSALLTSIKVHPAPPQRKRNLHVRTSAAGGPRGAAARCPRPGGRPGGLHWRLVKGGTTNHVLHLILSLVTCGLWLFVWPIVWLLNQRKTLILSVDAYGNILRQG